MSISMTMSQGNHETAINVEKESRTAWPKAQESKTK